MRNAGHTTGRRAAAIGSTLLALGAGPLAAQVAHPGTGGGPGLQLVVSPLASDPAGTSVLVLGGTPGERPLLVLSARHAAPVEALQSGVASAQEVELFLGAPFRADGRTEIAVPKPTGGFATPIYAQAVGLSAREAPDLGDPSQPLILNFVGGLSQALGGKHFCLENYIIDDPLCSTTNLGTQVGMMMEDGFGFAEEYSFLPGALYSQTFTGETGSISAQIVNRDNPSYGWSVSIIVAMPVNPGDPGYPPAESPYFGYGALKTCPSYLVANGGTIDPGTWHYFETSFGTMVGTGGWSGAQATLDRFGPAFQIGRGANTTNLQLGIGAWFDLRYLTQPTSPSAPPLPSGAPVNCELFGQTRPCPQQM